MKRVSWILIGLLLVPAAAVALSKSDVRAIILAEYPGAKITDIEKEQCRGQKIFEVDFKHGGENLEAIIGLDGEIIKVGVDD